MDRDVRRTRAVVCNPPAGTVLRSGSACAACAFHPSFESVRPNSPHSLIGRFGILRGQRVASGHGQFLYVVPTPGDRHFNRDLWQLHFGEPDVFRP